MRPVPERFDIFCRVVDNFGDAGVALRLARQLANEHRLSVRLWIDDLRALARMAPGLDSSASAQFYSQVEVLNLALASREVRLPDVVIEAFGCGLPTPYLDAMEAPGAACSWINLEYLSAEPWIEQTHGLPSPQPHRSLTRWFYFPGFARGTGGLIREAALDAAREAWLADAQAHDRMWQSLGIDPPAPDTLTVSLFCYPNRAIAALLARWSDDHAPVLCVVPEGVAEDALDRHFGGAPRKPGMALRSGALTIALAPFVDHPAFDRRLWSCSLNIVRGEDSFVRAQWARRPMVWHVYPQDAAAHLVKLEAFLDHYTEGLATAPAQALRRFWSAFNADDAQALADAWAPFRSALPALATHATRWGDTLAGKPDLASQLVGFARNRL